jgi:hypothetical protein
MPTLRLAIMVLLVRFSISQIDVPTRQSCTMAIVAPDERAAAAGITRRGADYRRCRRSRVCGSFVLPTCTDRLAVLCCRNAESPTICFSIVLSWDTDLSRNLNEIAAISHFETWIVTMGQGRPCRLLLPESEISSGNHTMLSVVEVSNPKKDNDRHRSLNLATRLIREIHARRGQSAPFARMLLFQTKRGSASGPNQVCLVGGSPPSRDGVVRAPKVCDSASRTVSRRAQTAP